MISNLQFLRAFAAINVVIYHIIGTSIAYSYDLNLINKLAGWGANGVDVFFVISGFIMYFVQNKNPKKKPIEFFKSRLIRIVPLYWLMTFLSFGVFYILPSDIFNGNAPPLSRVFESLFFLWFVV